VGKRVGDDLAVGGMGVGLGVDVAVGGTGVGSGVDVGGTGVGSGVDVGIGNSTCVVTALLTIASQPSAMIR
jgi:hypothetical protein